MKKINLGIIGDGNHFKKNILPALKKIDLINKIEIYKRNLEEEFFSKNFDIVYISCDSGLHEYFITKCLENNFNVMCEKPLSINYKEFMKLINLASKKNLLIFECFMYRYHKAFGLLEKYLKNKKIKYIYSAFKIPALDKKNFRYYEENGGFFWDTAVYPISLESFLIKSKEKLNIKSSMISRGVSLVGNINIKDRKFERFYKWGENQKYENSIEIITNKETFYINKFFSKKKNEEILFEIYDRGKNKSFKIVDDQFYNMFNTVLKNFKNNNFQKMILKEIKNHFIICDKILRKSKKMII